MKINILFLGITISALLALHGCGQDASVSGKMNNAVIKDIQETPAEAIDNQDSLSQPLESLADVRHPDMKIRVRKGNTLHLETDGFQLLAVDTALMHTGVYSVTSLMDEELAPLPQGMRNMTAATAGYRLLPSGEHFAPYAELRVAYDPDRLPLGYTPEDIYTSYYDTVSMSWVRLERLYIDTVSHEIVSATTHFTDFINELLKAPEMPETQAFVPTAMSDLEAVNPLDGLTIMQPPTANAEGTANLSYPIWTPAGRAGMQPNLVLTYNSAGGNGWLGVGWDISVPAITLDTRWGVPRYSDEFETEIYLLGGEQLVTKDDYGHINPMPHRTNQQIPRLPDLTQFFARTGDAHDSIIRHNGGTDKYWWEVVDRMGVTHYYGHYPVSIIDERYPSTLSDPRGNIARWMLCESRDPYGNWIRYFYDTVSTGGNNPGVQIYLDSISYTGYSDIEDGIYSVVFKRLPRLLEDRPVNCNNGFKEETSEYLEEIRVKTKDTVITLYYFKMDCSYSTNFKHRLSSVTKVDNPSNRGSIDEIVEDHRSGKTRNASCDEFRQEFDYYDMPPINTLFDTVKRMTVTSDDLTGFMLTPCFRCAGVNNATALGLSHTSIWNIGGTLGAGVGFLVWNTDLSIGGNYNRGGEHE